MHIANILKEGELQKDSVIKNYLTTASDGKNENDSCISRKRILKYTNL